MAECLICEASITALNDSEEHIILNAFGGRKKVRGLLCRSCNSKAGETWDGTLAKQLMPLSLMFDVSRERSSADPKLKVVTTAGERLTLGPGGKLSPTDPVVSNQTTPEGNISYTIKARSSEEARQIVRGLARKHPGIDPEAVLQNAHVESTYPQGYLHHVLSIGGEVAGRSLVKSCVAIGFSAGLDWRACKNAVTYLRQQTAKPCFGYVVDRDLVQGRILGCPITCAAVKADPGSGLILGYAEYFGAFRAVVCLGEDYTGPLIETTLAIDPRTGTELPIKVTLPFDRTDVDKIYAYDYAPFEAQQRAVESIIGPELKRQHEAEQTRLVSAAVDEAFAICGAKPGETLTSEHLAIVSSHVAGKMLPHLLHRLKPAPLPRSGAK